MWKHFPLSNGGNSTQQRYFWSRSSGQLNETQTPLEVDDGVKSGWRQEVFCLPWQQSPTFIHFQCKNYTDNPIKCRARLGSARAQSLPWARWADHQFGPLGPVCCSVGNVLWGATCSPRSWSPACLRPAVQCDCVVARLSPAKFRSLWAKWRLDGLHSIFAFTP